jgi:hypothetical protein
MPKNRKWRPIENVAALAGLVAMMEDRDLEESEQAQICAETYLNALDDLYNGTHETLSLKMDWPPWPAPTDRQFVSLKEAKERAQNPKNLRTQAQKVLRECRKLEAVLDNIYHERNKSWPTGTTVVDKLRFVEEALWRNQEQSNRTAIPVDGIQLDNVPINDASPSEVPEDFARSHQYFLAWSMFGSLGLQWENISKPDTGDGPAILNCRLEPTAVKTEGAGDAKENVFPKNPKKPHRNTSRAAHRKKMMKVLRDSSDDEDSDDLLSDIQTDLHDLLVRKKQNDRLKAAKELAKLNPTKENKDNYIHLLEKAAAGEEPPPARRYHGHDQGEESAPCQKKKAAGPGKNSK